jgi:hypothetical protein
MDKNDKRLLNLKPLKKGDPRCAELQRQGAEKKKENIAKRKSMREDLDILLKLTLKKGDMVGADEIMSLAEAEGKNISVQTAMDIAMVQRAMLGDVQAYLAIRDTVGEKPTDKVQMDQSLTIESWAKNHNVKL